MSLCNCLFKRLRKCQSGISALEFALVAPAFFILLFLSIETSFSLIADAMLDRTANRITRLGKLGIDNEDCTQRVMSELQDGLSFWADTTRIYADVKIYTPGVDSYFDDIDDETYIPVCNAGERGDMVIYRVGFEKPGLTGILSLFGANLLRFERVLVIQNEP